MRFSPACFALRSRSFGIFAAGYLVSQAGEWMTLVALNWAVYEFTGSALYLGLINACGMVPAFLLSVPAGVLADRSDRRKLLILLQAGIIPLTVCVGYLLAAASPFWLLAVVVTLRSVLVAVVIPVRNSLIPNLVPESQVASAVAVESAVRNLSRIAGTGDCRNLAGRDGGRGCVLDQRGQHRGRVALPVRCSPGTQKECRFQQHKSGYPGGGCLREEQSVRPDAFDPGRGAYGVRVSLHRNDAAVCGGSLATRTARAWRLLSVAAAGALVGSAWLTLGNETEGAGKWLVCSIIGSGLFLLLFMVAETLVTAAVMMFLVGLASSTYRTMSRVTLQTRLPDRLRGRILSIALMDRGLMPLGAILIGAVAEWAGALWAGVVMGGGCISVTLAVLAARRQIWSL